MAVPSGCKVVQSAIGNVDRPVRSAIVITDPELKYVEDSELVTEDVVGVILKISNVKVGIVSVYLHKEVDIGGSLIVVKRIVQVMGVDRMVVGGDVNARSPWWGGDAEDERGRAVTEAFAELGLEVLNEGVEPTYRVYRSGRACTAIIDVTACSAALLAAATGWRVDDTCGTLSDHRPISFTLQLQTRHGSEVKDGSATRLYNTKKADWLLFSSELERELNELGLESSLAEVEDREGVNELADQYTACVIRVCEKAIPRIPCKRIVRTCKWWTAELLQLKAEMVRRRRRIAKANPRRRQLVVDHYLEARAEYKTAIESAMTKSWKDFCTGEKIETVWQRSYRIMKACSAPVQDRLLRLPNGTTLDEYESASLLAETFYSRDDAAEDTSEQSHRRARVARLVATIEDEMRSAGVVAFTETELEAVLRAMSPKKAPGGDGLTLDICLTAYTCNRSLLLGLFSRCLRWGCFPRIWKTAIIKVIPKPAREDYNNPKSYRPIGLLPVLGKMLEKLFVNRLQWQLGSNGLLSPYQYGFTPQRSTEDALFDAMAMVRGGLESKDMVVMVSLDIEGAFDNAWWPAIIDQLHANGVDLSVVRLIVNYLSERRVRLRYAGETVERETNKGCIQGSTCGPILWNLQLNPLLEQSQYGGVRVQAFADDILMIAIAANGEELEEKVNRALAVMVQWGVRLRLKFAPGKTQALLITKKKSYYTPRLIMSGDEISYSASLKILGLTIDPLLNFRRHLEAINKKAIAFYKMVARAARAQWGLNSDILRLIYISVVEPTVLYAASCWAGISTKVYAEKALNSLTRTFAIKICKAHRTVSFVSSLLLARLLPLSLRIREHAQIYEIKRGKPLTCLPGRSMELRRSPFSLLHPAERKRVEFGLIRSQEDVEGLGVEEPILYTDGSKLEGKVGAAVSCWNGGVEFQHCSFRLEDFCSVFQAELSGILRALHITEKLKNTKVHIVSDSRSSLEVIGDPNTVNPLAVDIRDKLCYLQGGGKEVALYWVKAHCGILGNERADELAKYAALNNRQQPKYDRFPLSFAKHSTRSDSLEEWQHSYDSATTGATTKLFFKNIVLAYRVLAKFRINNYITQILTGHGGFNYYLHRFKLKESALCTCGEDIPQTVQHLLVECSKFNMLRYDCECAMQTDISLDNLDGIMLDKDCRPLFLTFARTVLRKIGKENGSIVEVN